MWLWLWLCMCGCVGVCTPCWFTTTRCVCVCFVDVCLSTSSLFLYLSHPVFYLQDYSPRLIYAAAHTSPSLLSLASYTPSSYSFLSLISSAQPRALTPAWYFFYHPFFFYGGGQVRWTSWSRTRVYSLLCMHAMHELWAVRKYFWYGALFLSVCLSALCVSMYVSVSLYLSNICISQYVS